MPPKRKETKPDTHLKDYLEERDVLLEFLKINELRGFCKKLHKTWEDLDNDKGYELEQQKLLAYWKIINQQTRRIIDERQTLQIFKIDKTQKERLSAVTEKKKILSKYIRDCKIGCNFKKSRMINRNIINHKLLNRQKELMHQAHTIRKKCIMRNYDSFRAFMHANVVAYKRFLPVFYKLSHLFVTLQREHYDKLYMQCKKEHKKQTRNELQMLKRKEHVTRNSIFRLTMPNFNLRNMNKCSQRVQERKTISMRNSLRRTKAHYFYLRKREEELINKLGQGVHLTTGEEINSMLNISRHVKDIIGFKKKFEKQLKSINEKNFAIKCQYAISENDYCNETKFVKEVRKLTLDEADNVIINHMAKKLLPSIKINSLKKRIRIIYYILKNVLKSDKKVDEKINEVITDRKANSINTLHKFEIVSQESSTNLLNPDENDPFNLNCIPDIHISGFVPDISMHQTCKEFIAEQRKVEIVDFNNKLPDEQFKLFEENASENRCVRFRLDRCMKKNNFHVNNAPISISQEAAPKLDKYIKTWEVAMKKILQKNMRYQNYYKFVEEDEQEVGEVVGAVEGEVSGQESVQEEIQGEQDKWEKEEQMEDKQVLAEEEEDSDDASMASSAIASFTSSETVTSASFDT